MSRTRTRVAAAFVALITGHVLAPQLLHAAEGDRKFFKSLEGDWSGPGEIVAGKFKDTRFTCNFKGSTPKESLGMALDGGCRVGMFTQKMSAKVERSGSAGYKGLFMDGASGAGLDIVGGDVRDGNKVVLSLLRNQLNGIMQARVTDDDMMVVTVSVRVGKKMVPVIGMNLRRIDQPSVDTAASD